MSLELKSAYSENIQPVSVSIPHSQVRTWLENSPVSTEIVDLNFNLQYMSSSGVKNLKIKDITEFYGKPYPSSFYPDSFKVLMTQNLVRVKETGETVTQEAFVIDMAGKVIWYHSHIVAVKNNDDQIESIMVVSMDITDKRQAEVYLKSTLEDMRSQNELQTDELFKSEERFSLAMQGANDGLWDWELETDQVYYSPRWKSMLGYQEHELENNIETWARLVHPDDKDLVLKKVADYLEGRADSFEAEMRMQHKSGHEIYVLTRAFCVNSDEDNKPVRLVGTHVDITDRKKLELFDEKNAQILEMIAIGKSAASIYDAIALMYEARHPGLRCSMLELHGNKLMHGGAPSLPEEYCEAVNGLVYGPEIGSCGSSTYTGKRVLVENIETDPKWKDLKSFALPHGLRCCWSQPIKDSSGKVLGAFGMYYDHTALPNEDELNDLVSAARLAGIVMERDQAQRRIRQLAYYDELTGLASRAYFYQYLDELIKTSSRHNHRFSLLYIDLDDFKNVNDSLGHDVGDLLLKKIARRLESIGSGVDFIARLSGDEFCILVRDNSGDYSAAEKMAQRFLDIIAQPLELVARKHSQSCSIGIAHYPEDGEDISTLVKAADTSLYVAKEQGKNNFSFYRRELSEKAEYRLQFEQYLREAIDNQLLSLVYQPQIDISSGRIVGVEALSRWYHPVLGQVSPVDFISCAERMGLIKPLTEWVLTTACSQAVNWKKAGLPVMRMAVNISPSHFLDRGLVSLIKRITEETGMDPGELELEVTEGVVQTDQENLSVFQELRDLGVLVAIDDFGTGYSSLASLKHILVDSLKIDKYFIDDVLTDSVSQLLIGSMIEMGHNLGFGIIAEGVETSEQLAALKKMGCEIAQGYLYSKAVSQDAISQLLSHQTS